VLVVDLAVAQVVMLDLAVLAHLAKDMLAELVLPLLLMVELVAVEQVL
jgi:hypothetical protein